MIRRKGRRKGPFAILLVILGPTLCSANQGTDPVWILLLFALHIVQIARFGRGKNAGNSGGPFNAPICNRLEKKPPFACLANKVNLS